MQRRFTFQDQLWFRDVSGDANPIHVDPDWAAVNFPGELVVHGVHAVLWAIDAAAKGRMVAAVKTTFVKPIVIGDLVVLRLADNGATLRLFVQDELMMLVRLTFGGEPGGDAPSGEISVEMVERGPVLLPGLAGELPAAADVAELAQVLPGAAASLGPQFLTALTRLSTLVGMECPGLRSLFAEFDAKRSPELDGRPIAWRVRRFNPLFSRVELDVEGCGIRGHVVAYAGRASADPGDEEIAAAVTPGEFAGAQPLVIGGSGGLGATAARLLAAGGAEPTVTWKSSAHGAETVRASIERGGGRCTVLRFDAQEPDQGLAALDATGWRGGQAYFFATPRIFRRGLGLFRPDDLALFTEAYVTSFHTVAMGLKRIVADRPLTIFYPSTVAVEERVPDLLEYGMAKAAGERLAEALQHRFANLRIVVARLPRIDTRQTQSFVAQAAAPPHDAILPWLRRVQA